jgi:hypothetical protein
MLLEAHLPGPLTRAGLQPWVFALAAWNCDWLKRHPETPSLYQSGVRYKSDPIGSAEDFRPIPRVLSMGCGDCDDLAAWRVAELRVREHIRAVPEVIAIKPGLWHVFVRLPDGRAEDVSAHLGMQVPKRYVEAGKRRLAAARTGSPSPRDHYATLPVAAATWPLWGK